MEWNSARSSSSSSSSSSNSNSINSSELDLGSGSDRESNNSKRIICLRHCEEPNNKSISKIQSRIGMNDQGAVRTYLMSEMVERILNNHGQLCYPYELHTYTHMVKNFPVSRAFYTCQGLTNGKRVLYESSEDIDKLIESVKGSDAQTIVICWEHRLISEIIEKLIGMKPDYDKISKQIYDGLDKEYPLKEQQIIKVSDLALATIKYCSDSYLKHNLKVRDYYIKPKKSIEYSLTWDIDMGKKLYKVYPNYLIKRKKKKETSKVKGSEGFTVFKYL